MGWSVKLLLFVYHGKKAQVCPFSLALSSGNPVVITILIFSFQAYGSFEAIPLRLNFMQNPKFLENHIFFHKVILSSKKIVT